MHHVVFVGSGSDLKIYVDGELKATDGYNTSSYNSSAFDFNIGGGGVWDASGNWFDGSMDEVAVWDIALTAEAVSDLYSGIDAISNSENYSGSSDLIAYWSFDEGSGDIAYDLSDNGNDGTINGASWIENENNGILFTYTPDENYNFLGE